MNYKCKHCGSDKVVYDYIHGEIICNSCGAVIDEMIDVGKDWRAFSYVDFVSRARAGKMMHPSDYDYDYNISTAISGESKDGTGNKLNEKQMLNASKLRKIHEIVSREYSIARYYQDIIRICNNMNMPEYIKKEACMLIKKAHEMRFIKGKPLECVSAVCIYIACKKNNYNLNLLDLLEYSNITEREFSKCLRKLCEKFNINIDPPSSLEIIRSYIEKIYSNASCPKRVTDVFAKVLSDREHELSRGLIAAIVYLVGALCKKKLNDFEIMSNLNISSTTLKSRIKHIITLLISSIRNSDIEEKNKLIRKLEHIMKTEAK